DGKAANAVAYSAHRGVSTSFFLLRQKSLLRNENHFDKARKIRSRRKTTAYPPRYSTHSSKQTRD
ncbi:MAG: hypothetical protein FWB93_06590, partial [Oscillospiraceae bacterium]|nr:hypothetical protein [Oscillospiraceae bacterium]